MRFQRQRIATQSREVLRTVGARDGWLIETADVIRVGFGAAVDHVVLDHGFDAPDVQVVIERPRVLRRRWSVGLGGRRLWRVAL